MTLFLLPNLLGPIKDHTLFLPKSVDEAVATLDGLIAESDKEGRRYLKRFKTKKKAEYTLIALLNEHTPPGDMDFLLEPVLAGENWGVVSDCGLPCLADPGALLVLRARALKIPIIAFPGPSSIVMALMLSGLSGQRFVFHGYISKDPAIKKEELKKWEKEAQERKETQIFMEAPYRNVAIYETCLETLHEKTLFCVACDLTLPSQFINTLPISIWRKQELPPIEKHPTLFLIG